MPKKGIPDLVNAFIHMTVPAELVLFEEGTLRPGIGRGSSGITVIGDLTDERMAEAYAAIDVLVLPARSTPTWTSSSAVLSSKCCPVESQIWAQTAERYPG